MLTDAQVCMTSMIYLFRPPLTAKAIYRKTAKAKLYTYTYVHEFTSAYNQKIPHRFYGKCPLNWLELKYVIVLNILNKSINGHNFSKFNNCPSRDVKSENLWLYHVSSRIKYIYVFLNICTYTYIYIYNIYSIYI